MIDVTPARARGHRLRRGRCSLPNHVYHVTTATHGRARLFTDFFCGRQVVDTLRRESASGRCTTLCFVVMPDHLHWLVQLSSDAALSSIVRNVKSCAAHRIARSAGAVQRVWQRGFHDHALRREEDLIEIGRYIVANPGQGGAGAAGGRLSALGCGLVVTAGRGGCSFGSRPGAAPTGASKAS